MRLLGVEGHFPEEEAVAQGTAVLGDDYQLLNPITGFRCPRRELEALVASRHVTLLPAQELQEGHGVSVVTVIRRPIAGLDATSAPLVTGVRYIAASTDPMLVLVLLHHGWEEARAWSAEVRDTILLPALERRPPADEAVAIVHTGRILLTLDGAIEAWRVILRAAGDPSRETLLARNRPLLGPMEAARFDAILAAAT